MKNMGNCNKGNALFQNEKSFQAFRYRLHLRNEVPVPIGVLQAFWKG